MSVLAVQRAAPKRRRKTDVVALPPDRTHPRTIGWVGTTALAMGGSNQSLFLLGALLASQGSAAVPLLIVGLLLGWMAAFGWTELIMMWPNRVGGIAATCAEAFRPYSPVLANLTGVCYWWGWVPACGLTAILSADALHDWYVPWLPVPVLATGIVLAFLGVNLCGIKWVTRFAIPIAAVSATLAFLSVLIPVLTGSVDWHHATDFDLASPFNGVFGKLTSAMAGLYLIGFAAPAFEAAACHVGETVDAKKNVPRAMLASGLMASLYFVAVPVVWLGVIGPSGIGGDLPATLGPTFAPVLGAAAKSAAIWFVVMNMFHGTLQPLAGAARTLSQLSEDGLLPRFLAWRNRNDVPWAATTLTACMAIAFLQTGDPTWVIAAANMTYLIGICLPSIAVWLLRRNEPGMERPYRAPRGTIVLGVAAAGVWGLTTVLGFEQFGLPTVLAGIALAYAGSALYAFRRWSDRRRWGTPRLERSLHMKLTGAMLLVMVFDGAGYLIAVSRVDRGHMALVALLEDVFVIVALLTISVGLVLPGMIAHAAQQVAAGADRLARGTLADLTRAMEALAAGDLDRAHARVDRTPVRVKTRDEVGLMARNFNIMKEEIANAAVSLDGAREGLLQARNALNESNEQLARWGSELEQRVEERTAQVRASEHRFRTIFETSAAGIVATDRHGNIVTTNAAFEEMIGSTKDELFGRGLDMLTAEDDRVAAYAALAEVREKQGELHLELRYERADGTLLPARVSLASLSQGEATQMVIAIVEDITEQKRLEDQLRQSQKMEAVGSLAGGIAHDFNNLLTVISGYGAFALERVGDGDPQLRAEIEEITRAADRAASLTRQLLAFSRRQVLQMEPLDVNEIVEHAEKFLGRLIDEHVEIHADLEAGVGTVRADRGQIEQVILNLCVNARDAMPGGGKLTIATLDVDVDEAVSNAAPGALPGSYVVLSVTDTGRGMDEHTLARAFEPFFTTKEVGAGTGLGLSTVEGIVRQSGGFLHTESEPGVGTTVSIYLPRVCESKGEVPVAMSNVPSGNERILLVEDEPVLRELAETMLRRQGYDVSAAPDPGAALERFGGGFHYDLLLTDVVMPQMSGAELAERLAELQPGIKVLFMSGYTRHAITEATLEPGKGFLQKPFDAETLALKVREVLDSIPLTAP